MDNKQPKDTLVVNFYGGPGTGKSIMMSNVFALLKWRGITAEMAPEYAKEQLWQEPNPEILNNQLYIFAKQHNRVHRLLDKVDVVVTDAPLLNSIVYDAKENQAMRDLVAHEHSKLKTCDILLKRTQDYEEEGRMQTKQQAIDLDEKIQGVLNRIITGRYHTFETHPGAAAEVVNLLTEEYEVGNDDG